MMRGQYHEAERAKRAKSRIAFLGLGSNLGNRIESLKTALKLLGELEGISVTGLSSVYETAPVDVIDQPAFLNMVARVTCELAPEELLDALQGIERKLGRTRTVRRGPRTIDLDILLIDDLQIGTERLQVPHPEITRRQFVLVPLAELSPDITVPGGATVGSIAGGESDAVRRLGSLEDLLEDTCGGTR